MKWFVVCVTLLATSHASANEQHTVSDLTFMAPEGVEITRHTLGNDVESIAVTQGEQGLVLVLYRGDKTPSEKRVLRVHLEELEVRLMKTCVEGSLRVSKEPMSILGRRKNGRRLLYSVPYAESERKYLSKLAARRVKGLTIVVLWSSPVLEDEAYFAPVLLKSLKQSGKRR